MKPDIVHDLMPRCLDDIDPQRDSALSGSQVSFFCARQLSEVEDLLYKGSPKWGIHEWNKEEIGYIYNGQVDAGTFSVDWQQWLVYEGWKVFDDTDKQAGEDRKGYGWLVRKLFVKGKAGRRSDGSRGGRARNAAHKVHVVTDGEGCARAVVIWSRYQEDLALLVGKVLYLDLSSGIVCFRVLQDNFYNGPGAVKRTGGSEEAAKFLYQCIRDLYHRHVWSTSDYALFPKRCKISQEMEQDCLATAKMIWEDLFSRGVMLKLKQRIRSAYFRLTEMNVDIATEIDELCAMGEGELQYAEAMCTRLAFDDSKYLKLCQRGKDTYQTITRLVGQKQTRLRRFKDRRKIDVYDFIVSLLAGTLAQETLVFSAAPFYDAIKNNLVWSLIIGELIVVVILTLGILLKRYVAPWAEFRLFSFFKE